MCGRSASEHNAGALANPCLDEWSLASDDCIAFRSTTAYGEIEFPNGNIAKVLEQDMKSGQLFNLVSKATTSSIT